MPLTVVGSFQFFIIVTFSRFTLILFVEIIKPKNFIQVTLNSNFLMSTCKLALQSRSRTFRIWHLYFNGSSE
jgi:hypothetical protein